MSTSNPLDGERNPGTVGPPLPGVETRIEGDYDTRPIIAQREVPVMPDGDPESLARRVQGEEHRFLVETLQDLVGRVRG